MSGDLRVPVSQLETDDDAEMAWRVIEPAFNAVDIYGGTESLAADLALLSPGQRALLALHWCVSEISNGGFDQFFTNASGLLASEAVQGFERIGASESARVLREAISIFASRPDSLDSDDPEFDAYLARHAPLEDVFYELMDTELYPRAAVYIRGHRDEFVK